MNRKMLITRIMVLSVLAGILILIALFGESLAPNDPYSSNALAMRCAPNSSYLFGGDNLGRCVFSRTLAGAKTSILAALALTGLSFLFGSVLGTVCGFYGGIVDSFIMRIADALLAFPQMVLAIAVAGILGGSLMNAMIALGITSWTGYARLARSHTFAIKNETFIDMARLSRCSDWKIIIKHIIPNIYQPLLVNATTQIGTTMLGIAGLSFLGLGVVPPSAEWGSMINEARAYIQLAPWAVFAPAIAVLITVMVFNYLGDCVTDLLEYREAD